MRQALFRIVGLTLALGLWTQTAHTQVLGQGPEDPVPLWRVFGALILCLVLAVVGAYLIKSRGSNISWLRTPVIQKAAERMELIESLRLGPQTNAWMIRCDAQTVLIVTSANGTTVQALTTPGGKAEDAAV